MVKPKGWGNIKPYYWCDTDIMRSVRLHIISGLNTLPENGVYIKGSQKSSFNSIELNTLLDSDILNIVLVFDDPEVLTEYSERIRLIMDDALIGDSLFRFDKEQKYINTHLITYTWITKK